MFSFKVCIVIFLFPLTYFSVSLEDINNSKIQDKIKLYYVCVMTILLYEK